MMSARSGPTPARKRTRSCPSTYSGTGGAEGTAVIAKAPPARAHQSRSPDAGRIFGLIPGKITLFGEVDRPGAGLAPGGERHPRLPDRAGDAKGCSSRPSGAGASQQGERRPQLAGERGRGPQGDGEVEGGEGEAPGGEAGR